MMHKKNIGNRLFLLISLCILLSVNINCSHETLEKKLINKEWELVSFEDTLRYCNGQRNCHFQTECCGNKYIYLNKDKFSKAFLVETAKDSIHQFDCKWTLEDSIINLNIDLYSFNEFKKVEKPIRYKIIELTDHTLELRDIDSPDLLNFYILMYNENNFINNYLN